MACVPCNCISPNVGRYFGLVTGPPPPPAMEATLEAMEATMEAAAATRDFDVCLFVNSIPEKLLDGFRRNLVGLGLLGPRSPRPPRSTLSRASSVGALLGLLGPSSHLPPRSPLSSASFYMYIHKKMSKENINCNLKFQHILAVAISFS